MTSHFAEAFICSINRLLHTRYAAAKKIPFEEKMKVFRRPSRRLAPVCRKVRSGRIRRISHDRPRPGWCQLQGRDWDRDIPEGPRETHSVAPKIVKPPLCATIPSPKPKRWSSCLGCCNSLQFGLVGSTIFPLHNGFSL